VVDNPMLFPYQSHLSAHVFSARRFSIITLARGGCGEAKVVARSGGLGLCTVGAI